MLHRAQMSHVQKISSKILFLDGDDEGAFIIPALDARSHVFSIEDRRNGVGIPAFTFGAVCRCYT